MSFVGDPPYNLVAFLFKSLKNGAPAKTHQSEWSSAAERNPALPCPSWVQLAQDNMAEFGHLNSAVCSVGWFSGARFPFALKNQGLQLPLRRA